MIRIVTLSVLLILLLSSFGFSSTLKTEEEVQSLVNNTMQYVVKGNLKAVFDKLKPYSAIPEADIEAAYLQCKSQRDQFKEKFAKTFSYEFIGSKKVGDSLIRLRYIEKGSKQLSVWIFYFYRNEEGWALIGFDWNDKFRDLFSE